MIKYYKLIIKNFDQLRKHNFDQTLKLLETFDQLKMSSEIRSTDPLSFLPPYLKRSADLIKAFGNWLCITFWVVLFKNKFLFEFCRFNIYFNLFCFLHSRSNHFLELKVQFTKKFVRVIMLFTYYETEWIEIIVKL